MASARILTETLNNMTKEEEVWKELENMGWSNKPKDMHLEYFQDIIKATKKALAISRVVESYEGCSICGEQIQLNKSCSICRQETP